ncbi:MAG: ATP-binding protein [Planctomycetota bacterium]|nr:ATP-binding protein [Planctomycetota bacterium]
MPTATEIPRSASPSKAALAASVAPSAPAADAPTPAQRLEDLSQIILAYNQVTQKLQASHESLQSEVVRLQEKLASADAQLQRSRRLAALGEMAAGIAHEIRNPLGAIQLYAGMIVEDLDPARRGDRDSQEPSSLEPTADTAKKIVSAVRGLNAIVCDVLSFARDINPRPIRVCVATLLDRAVEAHRPAIDAAGVTVKRLDRAVARETAGNSAVEAESWVWVDPELMHQALLNVIRNAVEAMTPGDASGSSNGQGREQEAAAKPAPPPAPAEGAARLFAGSTHKRQPKASPRGATTARRVTGGSAEVRAEARVETVRAPVGVLTLDVRADKAGLVIVVRDTGPGIASENIDRIFNPFFTTRNTGTGLGLAIVHRIVDAHGGAIAVRNDSGAVFEIRVPVPASRDESSDADPSTRAVSEQTAA